MRHMVSFIYKLLILPEILEFYEMSTKGIWKSNIVNAYKI